MTKKAEEKKPKAKMGRPKGSTKVPVDAKFLAQVEQLRGLGLPISDIAPVMGISEKTFHVMMNNAPEISTALERGRAKARAMVTQAAFKMASSGSNGPMTMFWLRTQAGWKEQVDINVNGKTTIVFETQYGDGVLRQDAKELTEDKSHIIDAVIDDLTETPEECPSSESESE